MTRGVDQGMGAMALSNGSYAVQAERAAKRYGKTYAVRQFDLELHRGQVCGLVGPNGAGKTTTISMLLGLIKPSAGRLSVLGFDPATDSFLIRQRIGYVPERHNIYQWMKVTQALAFASMVYPTWRGSECDRLTAILNLPLKRRVKDLSRGELAKLALVIALAHEPQLLILDEPTSGLDPIVRRDFLDVIAELIRHREGTVFFSTHILSDVERIADRIVVMNRGRVIADAPPQTLRSRYLKASFLFDKPMGNSEMTVPQAIRVEKAMREWVVMFDAGLGAQRLQQIAAEVGAVDCMIQPVSLDDAFVEMISSNNRDSDGDNGRPAAVPPGVSP